MMARFIIISNSRTGSTWLTTALNQVEDICTDYEIKIPPINYPKLPNHFLMEGNFKEIFWSSITENRVIGSKLVLDPKPHDQTLIDVLASNIDSDVKILFLTRCLAEQTISKMKSGHKNRFKATERHKPSKISQRLERETKALATVPSREIPLSNESIQIFTQAVHTRLANDLLLKSYLDQSSQEYMQVDYRDIDKNFGEICAFLGSHQRDIDSIRDFTITEKINRAENSTEMLFKAFAWQTNSLRARLLKQKNVDMRTIKSFYRI